MQFCLLMIIQNIPVQERTSSNIRTAIERRWVGKNERKSKWVALVLLAQCQRNWRLDCLFPRWMPVRGKRTDLLVLFPLEELQRFADGGTWGLVFPILYIWPALEACSSMCHLSAFHHSSLEFLTSCSCVLSLLSLFFPVSPSHGLCEV